MVTKEGYWIPFCLEGRKNGHQRELLEPVLPQEKGEWSPRSTIAARSYPKKRRVVANTTIPQTIR
ncbi:hypothetical protein WQ57_08820 [Mesobacillus campisalis]|uniref:Uncharacterized protein n=1 Tax=Mesobacillus campisalis TaxID=1408103 RepID=A0A0M2SZ64_9BACI|nr:hypothetical protein [Mesobacillus campisalis]KKK38287.1 hypothetical protein WQ57_08820 [Mesobacillus campisalis]